jgi:hypothetical protein
VPTILAYLDPGSGSLLLQLLLGGAAAAGVTLKLYWRKFLRLLHIRKDDEDHPETAGPPVTAASATADDGATRQAGRDAG